jgi:hypothetical protein
MPVWGLKQTTSAGRICGLAIFLIATVVSPSWGATPTPSPGPTTHLAVQLTTTEGCLETGQYPVYQVGDLITVSFRIVSPDAPWAFATLFDVLPNGFVGVFGLGKLVTNATYSFRAQIARPTGVEQLILKASRPDALSALRSCSFIVAEGTPQPTFTPRPTKTKTETRTPRNTPTPTPTGDGSLSGSIRTNRGCREDGDVATFGVGEKIGLFFQVNSATHAQALTSIADMLANGSTTIFSFGLLQTNVGYVFQATVAPPLGVETVELRARTSGPTVALDQCSFLVVASAPATATRTMATRTPTRTRTVPTSTATPTPTPTS